jgi:hypothetical protein
VPGSRMWKPALSIGASPGTPGGGRVERPGKPDHAPLGVPPPCARAVESTTRSIPIRGVSPRTKRLGSCAVRNAIRPPSGVTTCEAPDNME